MIENIAACRGNRKQHLFLGKVKFADIRKVILVIKIKVPDGKVILRSIKRMVLASHL